MRQWFAFFSFFLAMSYSVLAARLELRNETQTQIEAHAWGNVKAYKEEIRPEPIKINHGQTENILSLTGNFVFVFLYKNLSYIVPMTLEPNKKHQGVLYFEDNKPVFMNKNLNTKEVLEHTVLRSFDSTGVTNKQSDLFKYSKPFFETKKGSVVQ